MPLRRLRPLSPGPEVRRLRLRGVRLMARFVSQITKTGPLFKADIDKTLADNIYTLMLAIAKEGEADVRAQILPVSRSHETEKGIRGRVESLHGKKWRYNAVVSQTREFPWGVHGQRGFPGRGQAIYRGGQLEDRLHMFRRTASRLRSARAINVAELAKGLT